MPNKSLVGPYSLPHKFAKLSGRTREGQLVRNTRCALIKHCGGNPTVGQMIMIEQCAQLKLQLALMDRKIAETGTPTERQSAVYLAWSNALTRTIKKLGVTEKEAKPPAPSLADILGGPAV